MVEKREFPRVDCQMEVTVISNGNFFRDTLVNLSEEGAQIEIKRPLPLGRDILLKGQLGSMRLAVLGDIRWKDNATRRVGIQFLYLPKSLKRSIRAMARRSFH